MVTDQQIRRLRKYMQKEMTFSAAASKAGMDEKTARKYIRSGRLPSELKVDHNWRTRKNPFEEDWPELKQMLELNPGLEAKTLFGYLQRKYPGRYQDGQLRTLQRHVKVWRALEGPPKEVFFAQEHKPGQLCQSDFTSMNDLQITIGGSTFQHLVYHFVLPYSNWETGTICFSESFEALSEGLQSALWELGGVPVMHQSDRLSAAVNNLSNSQEFTERYQALLSHYRLQGRKINARCAHENGDVEQRHYRFKKALEQALLLRGSRNFQDRQEYELYLGKLFNQLNAGRHDRLNEELKILKRLPARRLESSKRVRVPVSRGSTIKVDHNIYSVNSRLIGEQVRVKVEADQLEVWYAQRCVERLPRLHGRKKRHIQYRHIIDWLVRKPGAFENYRYQPDLFPTHRFRIAYDYFKEQDEARAAKKYLRLLYLAAYESETKVDEAIDQLLRSGKTISCKAVEEALQISLNNNESRKTIEIRSVCLNDYDALLSGRTVTS